MARVLVPLPDRDFDVTEVSVPWRLLTETGHDVHFATERGALGPRPQADPKLLTGVLFGQLGADAEPKRWYGELEGDPAFAAPLRWTDDRFDIATFDALLLPGGHAPGMRQYLGSHELQAHVRTFWALDRPVAAICHGVLVAARAGVLREDVRTTCLPKHMERTAHVLATTLSAGRLRGYYRTEPAYVEDEVRANLADPRRQFVRGPRTLIRRGSRHDHRAAFVVEDGRYVSARWPGDAYLLSDRFLARL